MTIHGFFAPLIAAQPLLVYPVTFLSIILIGNPVSFAAFYLAFQENFRAGNLFGIVLLVLAADIAGDLAWFWLGKKLRGTKLGHFLRRHIPKHEELENNIRANSDKWIFLSKFIPSTTFAIIFSVGWADIKFKKFWPVSLAAIASSVLVLMAVAFGLASSLSGLEAVHAFKRFERLFVLALIIFFILNFAVAKISRKILRRAK